MANVAVGIARLGGAARFAGILSRDAFGEFLLRTLSSEHVDITCVRRVDEHTTLAFVARGDAGARGFEFFRSPGADSRLEATDVSRPESSSPLIPTRAPRSLLHRLPSNSHFSTGVRLRSSSNSQKKISPRLACDPGTHRSSYVRTHEPSSCRAARTGAAGGATENKGRCKRRRSTWWTRPGPEMR